MQLTKEQARICRDLRAGSEKALETVPEERHGDKLVAVKATDILALCDAVDALQQPQSPGQ